MVARAIVDFDVCASTGECMRVCPEVFELRADGHLYVLQEELQEGVLNRVREAADSCPTGAISIEEKGSGSPTKFSRSGAVGS